MKDNKNILIHVMISIGFLLIPFLFLLGEIISFHDVVHNPYNSFSIIFYLLLLIFFYFNFYVLIPTLYVTKRYSRYVSILILVFSLLLLAYYLLDYLPYHSFEHGPHHRPHHRHDDDIHRPHHIFIHPPPINELSQLLFLFVLGIFVTLYIRVKKSLNTIEQEKNNAELSYLKSQINPHFLFNTFNSIYSLAIKENADQTANGMLKLSGMMRYVVSETSSDYVPLEKELNYINDYIELQKLRLAKSIKLEYSFKGDPDDKQIAPLLLIPFIENAFKHGVNPDEDSMIRISIDIDENTLHLIVENNKVTIDHKTYEKMGFGIGNTKTRLNLLYPDSHTLQLTEDDKKYTVHLNLTLL